MQARKNRIRTPFKSLKHRHIDCQKSALETAKKHCQESGVRLTPLRERVLALIWQNHEPVKAYDILDQLKHEHSSSAPPTVYRALDFLQEEGLVHKIESLNAYVGCGDPVETHSGQFLICHKCGAVAELDDVDIRQLLKKKARQIGFEIHGEMIEIKGCCQECNNSNKN